MKFQELKRGNQTDSGTNHNIRREVMKPIVEKNPDIITLDIYGTRFDLKSNWSGSKKSVTYIGSLTRDDYKKLTGGYFGLSSKKHNPATPFIMLHMDGSIDIHSGVNYFHKIMTNENILVVPR